MINVQGSRWVIIDFFAFRSQGLIGNVWSCNSVMFDAAVSI